MQHMMEAPSASPLPNTAAALAAQASNANIPAAAANGTVLQPVPNPHNSSQGRAGTAGLASTVTAGVQQQLVPGSLPGPSLTGAGVVGQHDQVLQGADCLCPNTYIYSLESSTLVANELNPLVVRRLPVEPRPK